MGVYKLSGAGGLLTPRVNYTSMLAGNVAFVPSTYDLIETTILGSAASSVTFSSLATYASTYKHLQVRMVTQGPGSVSMRFNGVTSSGSYKDHRLYGFNGAVSSDTITTGGMYLGAVSTTASGVFSSKVIEILDPFSSTKNKTIRTLSGRLSDAPFIIELVSGLFISTASVTSINIFGSSDMSVGSRFSLYGIKG